MTGCRELGPGEAAAALTGVALVLAAPTALEAEPLRGALRDARSYRAATKELWVGRLAGRSGDTAAPVALLVTGYGKANVAHALTVVFEAVRPRAVILAGVAGAFPGSGLGPGDLVVAEEEVYGDTGASGPEGWLSTEELGLPLAEVGGRPLWNVMPLARGLAAAARDAVQAIDWGTVGPEAALPRIAAGRCVTVSRVSGTEAEARELADRWRPLAESMEGAAAAQVCLLYGIPLVEVRGISNLVGPRNRDAWRLDLAVERAGRAALAIAEDLLGGVSDGSGAQSGEAGGAGAEREPA